MPLFFCLLPPPRRFGKLGYFIFACFCYFFLSFVAFSLAVPWLWWSCFLPSGRVRMRFFHFAASFGRFVFVWQWQEWWQWPVHLHLLSFTCLLVCNCCSRTSTHTERICFRFPFLLRAVFLFEFCMFFFFFFCVLLFFCVSLCLFLPSSHSLSLYLQCPFSRRNFKLCRFFYSNWVFFFFYLCISCSLAKIVFSSNFAHARLWRRTTCSFGVLSIHPARSLCVLF